MKFSKLLFLGLAIALSGCSETNQPATVQESSAVAEQPDYSAELLALTNADMTHPETDKSPASFLL